MRFPYYRRLSRSDQAIYRQSDAATLASLTQPGAFLPCVAELERALRAADGEAVAEASDRIVTELCRQLDVEMVKVQVLASRPTDASEELHGLYETDEDRTHDRAVITVWMRTAARGEVVRFRTFLRTLLHEVCHHLDFWHFELGDSFHTEGFFKRESALMRQLAPKDTLAEPGPAPQLELPW